MKATSPTLALIVDGFTRDSQFTQLTPMPSATSRRVLQQLRDTIDDAVGASSHTGNPACAAQRSWRCQTLSLAIPSRIPEAATGRLGLVNAISIVNDSRQPLWPVVALHILQSFDLYLSRQLGSSGAEFSESLDLLTDVLQNDRVTSQELITELCLGCSKLAGSYSDVGPIIRMRLSPSRYRLPRITANLARAWTIADLVDVAARANAIRRGRQITTRSGNHQRYAAAPGIAAHLYPGGSLVCQKASRR